MVEKIIIHSHNNNIPKGIIKKTLNFINKKLLINKGNVFLACSEESGKWLYGNNVNFEIINNAIEMEEFKFDKEKRDKIRRQYNLEDKFVIGHVGRIEKEKNHEFLIDIFKEIKQKNNNARLLLVGEGSLENKIKQKVKDDSLENDVIFIGNSHKVSDYYQAMDVFVFPSLAEGLGIVLIEAQSNGLKCFTTKNKVPKEAEYIGKC